jgi:hypothetical protein
MVGRGLVFVVSRIKYTRFDQHLPLDKAHGTPPQHALREARRIEQREDQPDAIALRTTAPRSAVPAREAAGRDVPFRAGPWCLARPCRRGATRPCSRCGRGAAGGG